MAKITHDVMRWVDDELARDPQLRERVEQRVAELRLEQEVIKLRERQGLTQKQVGAMLGISQPAVAKIESGSENMTVRTLIRMVTALGGDVEIQVKPRAAKSATLRPPAQLVPPPPAMSLRVTAEHVIRSTRSMQQPRAATVMKKKKT